ncbi:hypothetical protein BC628DRAFT_558665 [Trametes gibbosa]|nr:hypothetical protein BC628DRAFT_558665 [Trametes gibbosa]
MPSTQPRDCLLSVASSPSDGNEVTGIRTQDVLPLPLRRYLQVPEVISEQDIRFLQLSGYLPLSPPPPTPPLFPPNSAFETQLVDASTCDYTQPGACPSYSLRNGHLAGEQGYTNHGVISTGRPLSYVSSDPALSPIVIHDKPRMCADAVYISRNTPDHLVHYQANVGARASAEGRLPYSAEPSTVSGACRLGPPETHGVSKEQPAHRRYHPQNVLPPRRDDMLSFPQTMHTTAATAPEQGSGVIRKTRLRHHDIHDPLGRHQRERCALQMPHPLAPPLPAGDHGMSESRSRYPAHNASTTHLERFSGCQRLSQRNMPQSSSMESIRHDTNHFSAPGGRSLMDISPLEVRVAQDKDDIPPSPDSHHPQARDVPHVGCSRGVDESHGKAGRTGGAVGCRGAYAGLPNTRADAGEPPKRPGYRSQAHSQLAEYQDTRGQGVYMRRSLYSTLDGALGIPIRVHRP